jgi:hypothetical protein
VRFAGQQRLIGIHVHQRGMPMKAESASEFLPRDLFTVEQFAERRPAWTEAALRNMILNSADRLNSRGERIPGNGLFEAGAIVRVGRRVLIDEQAFFRWIADQQRKHRANNARSLEDTRAAA